METAKLLDIIIDEISQTEITARDFKIVNDIIEEHKDSIEQSESKTTHKEHKAAYSYSKNNGCSSECPSYYHCRRENFGGYCDYP